MSDHLDSVDVIFSPTKQLGATLTGLRQMRGYVGNGVGLQMLEILIEEAETKLAEAKFLHGAGNQNRR